MQFLSTLTISMSAMLSLAAAGPLSARADLDCPESYVSCGKDGTNGDGGSRCAAECTYLGGPTSLGRCTNSCPPGYYPDACISGGAFNRRFKCSEL
ncbi:hypothetical protein CDEST_14257 [Colletotrichum destructivum]|uniref:EC56 protein n=1 Tax=Colletotrichum destructivum TaxID=34406 RepID=A0AAX4J1G1_9PEZI|nr:hypothetical protein CDEST_14257 [Colletotrichum destructivum]